MGRWFTAEEALPNGGYIVVLSYNFWTQRLGSDPNVLGKSVTLSGNAYTIVGVVGREFDVRDFGPAPEVWVPFQLDPNTADQGITFKRSSASSRSAARARASTADGLGAVFRTLLHGGRDGGNAGFQRDHTPGSARAPGAADTPWSRSVPSASCC
jgi:hypothetical protein